VEWLVHGYAGRGNLTAIAALPKTGKSTIVAQAAASIAGGFGFLGLKVQQAPVLWLDFEQHPARTLQMFQDLGALDLPIHLESSPAANCTVAQIRDYVDAHGIGLVVLDSLAKYWRGKVEDENDAVQVEATIAPLSELARTTNVAIWAIHHARKSGGEHGQDFRGSGALTGNVDVAISMHRPAYRDDAGTQRVLTAITRYRETPLELVVDFQDGLYTALGSVAEVKGRNTETKVLAALREDEAMTPDEVAEAVGCKTGTVRPALSKLYEENTVNRQGAGVRGNPWRYTKKVSVHEKT
jgi:replicative DNA helicase